MRRALSVPAKAMLLSCAILLPAGCLGGPFASPDMDRAAKAFTAPDNRANVYIVRGAAWPGYQCQASMDGRAAGWIGASSFQLIPVSPGMHTASCEIFDHTAQARFVAEAGHNYFFEVVASPGWNTPTVALRESPEESGKALVTRGRRAAGAME